MDGVVKNSGKPFNKQREKDGKLDGMAHRGAQHNEHETMKGSLQAAASMLEKADDLADYRMAKSIKPTGGYVK